MYLKFTAGLKHRLSKTPLFLSSPKGPALGSDVKHTLPLAGVQSETLQGLTVTLLRLLGPAGSEPLPAPGGLARSSVSAQPPCKLTTVQRVLLKCLRTPRPAPSERANIQLLAVSPFIAYILSVSVHKNHINM